MLVYFYDEITKIFTKSDYAQHDMFNIEEFLIPDNATTVEPPEFDTKHIPQFADNGWILIENHIGEKQVNIDTKEISIVDYYGNAKDRFQFVTDDIAEDIKVHPENYGVVENQLVDITNTTAWKKQNAMRVAEKLIEYAYDKKAERAYGGVVVLKDDISGIFETKQDSFSSILATLSFMSDDQVVDWKFYVNNTPTFIPLTKSQLFSISQFARVMILACFDVEKRFVNQVKEATYKQLNSDTWVTEFKTNLENEMNSVNNVLQIN